MCLCEYSEIYPQDKEAVGNFNSYKSLQEVPEEQKQECLELLLKYSNKGLGEEGIKLKEEIVLEDPPLNISEREASYNKSVEYFKNRFKTQGEVGKLSDENKHDTDSLLMKCGSCGLEWAAPPNRCPKCKV